MRVEPFVPEQLEQIVRLCELEGWRTLSENPARALRAFEAPGAVTLVALTAAGELVGFAQTITDGAIQAFLSCLLVAKDMRRSGVGRLLVEEAFARSGALRMDLLASDGSEDFYRSFPHRHGSGYRIALEEGGQAFGSWPAADY